MAGSRININMQDIGKIQARLDKLAGLDFSDVLDNIGALVESQVRRRLSEEKAGPDGADWADWSDRYAKTRHGGHDILRGEGDLIDSIDHQVSGNEVEIGSNLIYAATHQFGDPDRNIPERPYLGLSSENEADIEADIVAWLEEVIR
jgi:phage virion morphogenesis protein